MNTTYDDKLKQKVLELRLRRFTYHEIAAKTGIPVGTLSTWIRKEQKKSPWKKNDLLAHRQPKKRSAA